MSKEIEKIYDLWEEVSNKCLDDADHASDTASKYFIYTKLRIYEDMFNRTIQAIEELQKEDNHE